MRNALLPPNLLRLVQDMVHGTLHGRKTRLQKCLNLMWVSPLRFHPKILLSSSIFFHIRHAHKVLCHRTYLLQIFSFFSLGGRGEGWGLGVGDGGDVSELDYFWFANAFSGDLNTLNLKFLWTQVGHKSPIVHRNTRGVILETNPEGLCVVFDTVHFHFVDAELGRW